MNLLQEVITTLVDQSFCGLICLPFSQEILSLERRQTQIKAAVAGIHQISLEQFMMGTRYGQCTLPPPLPLYHPMLEGVITFSVLGKK